MKHIYSVAASCPKLISFILGFPKLDSTRGNVNIDIDVKRLIKGCKILENLTGDVNIADVGLLSKFTQLRSVNIYSKFLIMIHSLYL